MASLAWLVVRSVTTPTVAATLAAVGVASGILLLSMRKIRARLSVLDCQMLTLRRDAKCALIAQRMWTTDRGSAQEFEQNSPQENADGMD